MGGYAVDTNISTSVIPMKEICLHVFAYMCMSMSEFSALKMITVSFP